MIVTIEIDSELKFINEFIHMFNNATIKHLLLLCSDIFETHSNSSFTYRLFNFYSRISNMNIGTWPLENEELTNSHVRCREITSKENDQLFWTKAFLQTSSYDEKRYRQIASNACQRIVQEESKTSSSRSISSRRSSIIALSLSETSTRLTSSNDQSTPQTITLPIHSRKKPSYTRFSCYFKSHNIKTNSKLLKKSFPKNNNSKKSIIKLPNESHENFCVKCLKLLQNNSTYLSSNSFCQKCIYLIKKFSLNKNEEQELRRIIEIILEEFQDHFGQALNLSIKQMTQHLLSNIHLFYNHYQQEFEQLTKKYRLTFLERFIELIQKFQLKQMNKNQFIQQIKPKISIQKSITHPPDILSMSSFSGSIVTEKDRSESILPSNSISLSTTSNPSIIIGEKKNLNNNRKDFPIQNSSSKKTFTLNRTEQKQSLNKLTKQIPSSSQLIDAYRFRDTLRMNDNRFSLPRPKLR